jgi:acyl-CoA synthetase (AMP-forming)/AMP-acid ligase II
MITRFDGHKVFPVQIESIINKHKAVGTCSVIGIPDKDHAQGMMPLGVVELKSVEELKPVHYKQLLTYLKLMNKRVGLLINFNTDDLTQGVKRVVNDF